MSAQIVKHPNAARSYYTVRKAGRFWAVVLVTPIGTGRSLRTAIARSADREAAMAYGAEIAALVERPFKGAAP